MKDYKDPMPNLSWCENQDYMETTLEMRLFLDFSFYNSLRNEGFFTRIVYRQSSSRCESPRA